MHHGNGREVEASGVTQVVLWLEGLSVLSPNSLVLPQAHHKAGEPCHLLGLLQRVRVTYVTCRWMLLQPVQSCHKLCPSSVVGIGMYTDWDP